MFIEKPWATNVAHAHQLAQLCEHNGVKVMVAFSFRFHPAIVKLRQLMEVSWARPGCSTASTSSTRRLRRRVTGYGTWPTAMVLQSEFLPSVDAVRYLLGDPVL